MYFLSIGAHGQDESSCPSDSGRRPNAGGYKISIAEGVKNSFAHACHNTHVYDNTGCPSTESLSFDIGDPIGPIENGDDIHCSPLHAALIQVFIFAFNSAGSIQLLVGPASSLLFEAIRFYSQHVPHRTGGSGTGNIRGVSGFRGVAIPFLPFPGENGHFLPVNRHQ